MAKIGRPEREIDVLPAEEPVPRPVAPPVPAPREPAPEPVRT
jgi:hypothetical protein